MKPLGNQVREEREKTELNSQIQPTFLTGNSDLTPPPCFACSSRCSFPSPQVPFSHQISFSRQVQLQSHSLLSQH